ncbi:hypothetical protein, partial [Kineococcus siccus]|uniref:hypothetical protein n=1 Tax=Kineococcus siccus TaxID=2696567 RepID=UPI00196B24A5
PYTPDPDSETSSDANDRWLPRGLDEEPHGEEAWRPNTHENDQQSAAAAKAAGTSSKQPPRKVTTPRRATTRGSTDSPTQDTATRKRTRAKTPATKTATSTPLFGLYDAAAEARKPY